MDQLLPKGLGVLIQAGLLSTGAPVFADEAQDYYAANVEALVQDKCCPNSLQSHESSSSRCAGLSNFV